MEFRVQILEVNSLTPIEGADFIEAAGIFGFQSVIKKGSLKVGDKVVYIPEGALVPEPILEQLGLSGKLSGKEHNRVKAAKFKNCLSQGLVWKAPFIDNLELGTDVAEQCNITKYVPPIPMGMAGQIAPVKGLLNYDIENIKRWPNVIKPCELVSFQEKTHGTNVQVMFINSPEDSDSETSFDGMVICSKGLGAKGLAFKNVPENKNNLYVRTILDSGIADKFNNSLSSRIHGAKFHLFGEIYGKGVQDLQYGLSKAAFGLFDVYMEPPQGTGFWLDHDTKILFAKSLNIELLPFLYVGPFSEQKLIEYTSGPSIVGNGAHMREGIVVRPLSERYIDDLGRVILKSVSPEYLTRKGNVTEYA